MHMIGHDLIRPTVLLRADRSKRQKRGHGWALRNNVPNDNSIKTSCNGQSKHDLGNHEFQCQEKRLSDSRRVKTKQDFSWKEDAIPSKIDTESA